MSALPVALSGFCVVWAVTLVTVDLPPGAEAVIAVALIIASGLLIRDAWQRRPWR